MNLSRPTLPRATFRHACLLSVAIFTGLLALQKVYDYDLWWHLRSGQWIVEHGIFPKSDPFSFATAEAEWIYAYGLADPWFYLQYKWFGIGGLQLLTTAVIVAAALSLFLFVARRGVHPWLAAALLIWVVQVARFRFMVRPLVFKFAGIAFLFWFFYKRDALRFRYLIFFLGVLIWNWLYPAAFLAQLFAAFLLIEKSTEHLTKSNRYHPGDIRDAVILLLLSSLALLLNPNGFGLYRLVYGGFFADYAAGSHLVEEHQTLIWSQHLSFAALVMLGGVSFVLGKKNFRLLTLLIFAAFVVLAWGSIRYMGLSAFALAGVIGVNFTDYPRPAWLPSYRPVNRWLGPIAIGCLAGVCIFLWQMTFSKARVYEFGLGINQSRYPYAAVSILNEMNFSGNLYNSWKFGGFLQWHLPGAKTFIDGRYLPAQLELLDRFKDMDLHDFSRYLSEHEVKAALIDRQDLRDAGYFSAMPGFRLAHADDLSLLFVRSELLPDSTGTAQGGYRYLRLGGYEFEYLEPLAVAPEAPLVEQEILSAIKSAPESFFESFLLAYFYEARRDPRAAGQYLAAARKNPAFAFTHFEIGRRGGQAALRAERWSLAAEIITTALDYQKNGELYFLLGAARHKLKQWEAAEQAYRTSLTMVENGRVRNNLGFLLLDQGAPEKAVTVFEKAVTNDDRANQEQALYGLVLALRAVRREADAGAVRKRLLEGYPESQYLRKLEAR